VVEGVRVIGMLYFAAAAAAAELGSGALWQYMAAAAACMFFEGVHLIYTDVMETREVIDYIDVFDIDGNLIAKGSDDDG